MGRTTHFAQLYCTFMGACTFMDVWYLKAYRTTIMTSSKDDFFSEEDLDATLAIIDTNMFENDEDMK